MNLLVVDDPGHGGTDPGNVSNGRQEKHYCLSVSLLFKQALERHGVNVKMTRETDVFIGLSERARIANNLNAKLFVSWHNDSFDNPTVNGVAAWIHPDVKGTETEIIAQKVVNAIATATGQQNRGVRFADYQVLRDTEVDVHAVLIEGGFNTNPDESAKMVDVAFQKLQAEAAAKAVCEHYGIVINAAQPVDQVSDWAKSSWEKAIGKDIIQGDGTNFNPQGTLTREALIVILDRIGCLD